jgi:uncharacterized protein YeaO (DUF488 family)
MSLKTASIKKIRTATDQSYRISIISRHTLSDGVTPDPDISMDAYDDWWQVLSPPAKLIGAYYKRGLSWDDFAAEFQRYLCTPVAQTALQRLIYLAKIRDVTIMCVENNPQYCHRRLVAEACQQLDESLEVIIG